MHWVTQRRSSCWTQWCSTDGLFFAIRSGKEHRQLRHLPCQIEVVEKPGERAFLKYTEDVSKNRQGGLKGRNIKPKVVYRHANVDNPQRCFIRLFKRYMQLCPTDAPTHAFYLQPARSPSSTTWFANRPLGHIPLRQTLTKICKSVGIGLTTLFEPPQPADCTNPGWMNGWLWRERDIEASKE